jgi:hypothetical protein
MATASIQLDPKGASLFGTGDPTPTHQLATDHPVDGYSFTKATPSQQFFFEFKAPFYLSGNLTLVIFWYSDTGQTSGAVTWGAQIAAISAGDAQSMLTDTLATATTTTTTVNSTARGPTATVITISNLDSIAADDSVMLRVFRDGSSGADTMTGGAIPFDIELRYAATGGGGTVTGPGSSTDNAIVRWDGTTGTFVQNSAVTVADTTGSIDNTAGGGQMTSTRFNGFATGLREQSGPTDLTLQNVADQQVLKRSGTDFVGVDLVKGVILTSDTSAITTSLTTVYSLQMNPSSSWYWFDALLVMVNSTSTANTITLNLNFTGTFSAIAAQSTLQLNATAAPSASQVIVANNTSVTFAVNSTAAYIGRIVGGILVTGTGDLEVRISRATSGNVVGKAASRLVISEI